MTNQIDLYKPRASQSAVLVVDHQGVRAQTRFAS